MKRFIVAAGAAAGLFLCSFAVQAAALWFAADDKLYRLDPLTNQVTLSVSAQDIRQLAVTTDGSVWALSKKRLTQYASGGVVLVDLDLKTFSLKDASFLALDGFDGTLWLAEGKGDEESDDNDNAKRIVHLDAQGKPLGSFTSPGKVRALALGLDQTLWLLGNKQLWHYAASGAQLAAIDLKPFTKEEPKLLAVDAIGVWLWLAGEKQLIRLDGHTPAAAPLKIELNKNAEALALDPHTGTLWLVTENNLLAYGSDGALKKSLDLKAHGIKDPQALAFDPASRSLWLGHDKGLTSFSPEGVKLATIALKDDIEVIGVATFTLTPTLALLAPANGLLTNNPTPTFTLGYGALCNANPCEFANSFYSTYRLIAQVNNQSVGAAFVFDPISTTTNATASYTPTTRLPEGINAFSAQVQDSFGHLSNSVTSSFTVDTIAPRFSAIAPPDGASFTTPHITLTGSIDEAGQVRFDNSAEFNGTGPNPAGATFSYSLTLKPGLNTLNLSAVDLAGNRATTQLRYTLNSLTVNIDTPAPGAVINGGSVIVSGSFKGPANTGITVNGVVAAQVSDPSGARFYAEIPLNPGANTVTATAATSGGATATHAVSVTSSSASPIRVSVEPKSGIAPLKSSFTVQNNSANPIKKIEVDFNGDGAIDFTTTAADAAIATTYATPGVYQAKVTVTDSQNTVYTQVVLVSVQDGAKMDQMFKALWEGMNNALIAGDKAKALGYLNVQAKAKYGPVFDVLQPFISEIVSSYSALARASISGSLAEYAVRRKDSGVDRIYFVYFLQDVDGVWRIDEM